ncbi:hypothetical protein [Alteromonas sp. CYL-A6]|uniref:hypothetical protein n=1 Tax=Alteromonas nitratireducens TaxID=3390813 RepID=UPI0034C19EBB
MTKAADVLSIGVPALRFVRDNAPGAEVHVLTHGDGVRIMQLAEPSVPLRQLSGGNWPDDFLQGMEAFLDTAEGIINEGYTQIINLDTAFLPCFLARFLKDAGQTVAGNWLSMAVPDLIDAIQRQTLTADFVNSAENYLQSSWLSMHQWHTEWWANMTPPDYGYAEFYLRRCCGFSAIRVDMQLPLPAQVKRDTVAVYLPDYPYLDSLMASLARAGIDTFSVPADALRHDALTGIQQSRLLVTQPALSFWLARAMDTATLLVPGELEPRVLMPDYAAEPALTPTPVEVLSEGIVSLMRGSHEA